jgi:hypothetical protein
MPISKSVREITTSFVDQIAEAIDGNAKTRIAAALERMYGDSSGKSAGSSRPRLERRSLSPAAKRARKIQGQYVGTLRRFKGAARARIMAVAKKKGVAAAVKMMARLQPK